MVGQKQPEVLYRRPVHHVVKINDHEARIRALQNISAMKITVYAKGLYSLKIRRDQLNDALADIFERLFPVSADALFDKLIDV